MNRPNYLTEFIKKKKNKQKKNELKAVIALCKWKSEMWSIYAALSNTRTQGLSVTNPDLGFD